MTMTTLTDEQLRVALKHLHVRRDNFERSAEAASDEDNRHRFSTEVRDLTEVITVLESERSERIEQHSGD